MAQILTYIQAILSVVLVILVLLQRSEGGLGAGFGGDSQGPGRYGRRGAERTVFIGTVVVAVLFVLSTFASLFVV